MTTPSVVWDQKLFTLLKINFRTFIQQLALCNKHSEKRITKYEYQSLMNKCLLSTLFQSRQPISFFSSVIVVSSTYFVLSRSLCLLRRAVDLFYGAACTSVEKQSYDCSALESKTFARTWSEEEKICSIATLDPTWRYFSFYGNYRSAYGQLRV